jgi:hypothetical protein
MRKGDSLMPIKLTGLPVKSNWEFVAFYLIEPLAGGAKRQFRRTQIINDKNLKEVLFLLENVLKHKKQPEHPEETLQSTLQNMRDKGWIDFETYQGDYKLTDAGYEVLLRMKGTIKELKEVLRK